MAGKKEWAYIFPKSYVGGSVYIANRFHANWGVELGYDFSAKKGAKLGFPNNYTFFDIPVSSGIVTSHIKMGGVHFDVSYYFPFVPICGRFDLILSYGLGFMKATTVIETSVNTDIVMRALASLKTRPAYVWRAGVGLQTMLSDRFGFRILVRGEGTSRIRVVGNGDFLTIKRLNVGTRVAIGERPFKDTISGNIGLFARF